MRHIPESQLALFVGHDLPTVEQESVARHLAVCEACRNSVAEFEAAASWIRSVAPEPSEASLRRVQNRIRQRTAEKQSVKLIWSSAGVVVAMIALILVGRLPMVVHTEQPKPVSNVKVNPEVKPLPQLTKPITRAHWKRKKNGFIRPGITQMSVIAQNNGSPVIRMKTADPNVVILWIVSGGSEGEKNDGKGL